MTIRHKLLLVLPVIILASSVSLPANTARTERIKLGGAQLVLRVPDQPAPGQPWLWIAEFPGQHKLVEDAMLARGWQVAYVRVPNEFGSPSAMDMWEKAYKELRKNRGLAAKPAIWAYSRGGLYALSWLRRHPDRAGVLVLDNAVTDARSWPAGKQLRKQGAGDAVEWRRYIKRLGFANKAAALSESPRPAQDIKAAVKKGVILVSGYGTADSLVPHEDNGQVLVDFWRKHGGRAEVFPNEGGQHAPSAFVEPQPVIDLLVKEYTAR